MPSRVSRLVNRNVWGTQYRTSIRLEPEFWEGLDEVCHRERVERKELIRSIESTAPPTVRTSAVRVFLFQYFRDRCATLEVSPVRAEDKRVA